VLKVTANGSIHQRPRLGTGSMPVRRELARVVRRVQALISAEDLVALAQAEGLTDTEIRNMVASWEGRPWPPR
jgi:hypothetical protein